MSKNITQEELDRLKACTTSQEWSDTCDAIKDARDGQYPPDWWAKVILSGLAREVTARWGSDDQIHITTYTPRSYPC